MIGEQIKEKSNLLVKEADVRLRPTGQAFRDGIFQGSLNQLWAIVATVSARNEIEDIHGGPVTAEPGATVIWSGGECRYEGAARISPIWLESYLEKMPDEAVKELERCRSFLERKDMKAFEVFLFSTGMALDWDLPLTTEAEIETLGEIARQASILPSGRARVPALRRRRAFGADRFLREFLGTCAAGNPGPVEAADAGETVRVLVGGEWHRWQDVSHLSNEETEQFNRGLSSRLYALLIAIERACGRIEFEAPLPVPLFLADRNAG